MPASSLAGQFLNAHILALLQERDGLGEVGKGVVVGFKDDGQKTNGTHARAANPVVVALESAVKQAKALVSSTQEALETYKTLHHSSGRSDANGSVPATLKGAVRQNGVGSRELSGEMGGDTL